MTTRLIRYFGESDRERVEERLSTVVRAWATEWFSTPDARVKSVAFVREHHLGSGVLNLNGVSEGHVSADFEPFPLEWFLGRVGPRGVSPARRRLETELTRRAVIDFVEQVIGPTRETDSFRVTKRGEGCKVAVAVGHQVLSLSFTGACFHVAAAGSDGKPLYEVRPILRQAQARVELKAVIGHARIPLAELCLLGRGDVITLDTKLDGAADLEVGDRSIGVKGALGARHGLRAIKVGERQ